MIFKRTFHRMKKQIIAFFPDFKSSDCAFDSKWFCLFRSHDAKQFKLFNLALSFYFIFIHVAFQFV